MAVLDNSTKVIQEVFATAWYICEEDGPRRQVIQCTYDTVSKKTEWNGISNINCKPIIKGCKSNPDFGIAYANKTYFLEGEIARYRCPNGIVRKATCYKKELLENEKGDNKYSWFPNDNCTGCF